MTTKVPVNWGTSASGELTGVAIHDGRLVGFRSATSTQSYVIENNRSEIVEIELTGLVDFNVVRFCKGAITSEVFLWELAAVPQHLWSVSDSAWNTLFEGRASPEDAKATASRLVQARPEAFLFQLLCSYGGSFSAVCDHVSIYRYP